MYVECDCHTKLKDIRIVSHYRCDKATKKTPKAEGESKEIRQERKLIKSPRFKPQVNECTCDRKIRKMRVPHPRSKAFPSD
jgi:hypothetical protein